MSLPVAFHLGGKRGVLVSTWIGRMIDHGIGYPPELLDMLIDARMGCALFPADVDDILGAFEVEGWIRPVKWSPSFSRRAFLGLEGSGAAKGTAYTYKFDHTWEPVPERSRDLRALVSRQLAPPPPDPRAELFRRMRKGYK